MVEVESGREGGGSAGHGNGGSCSGLNIEEDEATLMRQLFQHAGVIMRNLQFLKMMMRCKH